MSFARSDELRQSDETINYARGIRVTPGAARPTASWLLCGLDPSCDHGIPTETEAARTSTCVRVQSTATMSYKSHYIILSTPLTQSPNHRQCRSLLVSIYRSRKKWNVIKHVLHREGVRTLEFFIHII